jgi:Fur family iron response transcriptional regulator
MMHTTTIEEQLAKAGIQPTAQRIAICRFLFEGANHPTAEDVKQWMDRNFPKVSLATVYNTLNLLVSHGLLKELRFQHDDRVVFDVNTVPHHHFLDEDTGELIDLDEALVTVDARLAPEYEIHQVHTVLIGRRRG